MKKQKNGQTSGYTDLYECMKVAVCWNVAPCSQECTASIMSSKLL
jgi:hypothetical protein